MLYIRRFGDDVDTFWRQLAEVHQIDYVQDLKPHGRQLFQWVEEEDRFERVESPTFLEGEVAELEARTAALDELAKTGQRGLEDVARMVSERRKGSVG